MFDKNIFERIVKKQYSVIGKHPYSIEEIFSIFEYYFYIYYQYIGKEHPYLKPEQIRRIIEIMPYCDDMDIKPLDYETLINSYFQTYFNSDRNINHFFSGDIRKMRMYENLL